MYEGKRFIIECDFCSGRTYLDSSDISAADICPYCGVKQYRSSIETETIHLNANVLEQLYSSIVVIPSFEKSEHSRKLISEKIALQTIIP